jgi:hypothetical protein
MIGVKEAVTAAIRFAADVYGEGREPTLEEVEPSSDERYWLITLGFADNTNPFAVIAGGRVNRKYKVFKVDAESGAVISMKIRETHEA